MSLQRLWKWDMSCIKFSSLSNYFVVVLYYDNYNNIAKTEKWSQSL